MLILHGHYRFGTRKATCRNDYCTHCRCATFTEGFRSFRVIHLFFIPLVPLGFFTDWRCTRCGRDPLSRRPMAKGLAIAGLVAGLFALVAVGLAPREAMGATAKWVMTAMFCALVAATLFSLVGAKRAEYVARRKAVEPLRPDACPYCREPVFQRGIPRCERCRIRIQ